MSKSYVTTFYKTYGYGPWTCHFCGKTVRTRSRQDGHIHHIDGDHNNNDPTNLAPTHMACHQRHHKAGKDSPRKGAILSQETRNKIAEKLRGRKLSPEVRANMSAARQRDREKISQGVKQAWAEGRCYNQHT